MFTSIEAAIEEARQRRKKYKRHFAVRQRRARLYVSRIQDCKRPCWTTLDDYRHESYGINPSRIMTLEPTDAPLIIGLLAEGISQRQVASKFDVSRGAIRTLIKRAKTFSEVRV